MLQLFKIEWLKVKNYRTFWVLFGAFLLLFPVTFFTTASRMMQQFTGKSMDEVMIQQMIGSPFTFPKVWQTSAWFGGLFFIIIGMLFIMLITNEVQYKTHRQNIIDGWTRMDFILAKSSLLLFFTLVSTAVVFVCGLLCGLIFTPSSQSYNIFESMYYVGYFALSTVSYLAVAFVAAILIKRTGLAIIIYFAFVFIIDNLLWLSMTAQKSQAGYFLPLESVDSLVPNPIKPSMMEFRTVSDFALIITAGLYITLMIYWIVRYYKNADLKS